MCQDCGCSQATEWMTSRLMQSRRIEVAESVVAKNQNLADQNRTWFTQQGVRVLNLMSSPGAGKTLLLEKTLELLAPKQNIRILVGDQEQNFDALRLQKAGAQVRQINTHSSCHLDAQMIAKEMKSFVKPHDFLIIENVGNLVCPAAFDLGEAKKVALLSTPEGEDKPAKYPLLFKQADLIVITKSDLIPALEWNEDLCRSFIRQVNPQAPIIKISAKTGEGLQLWKDFLCA